MGLVLTGLGVSVYTRVARMALAEKGLDYRLDPVDPFADPPDAALAALHPFHRVPVLGHDGYFIYETAAILCYLNAAFPDPALVGAGARAQGRVAQVCGIVDAYGYWPMVRQVFGQRVFRPLIGECADEGEIAKGVNASHRVLAALETIAAEGLVLNATGLTLADIYLAPMVDYFRMAPEGQAALNGYPALMKWWAWMAARDSLGATAPDLGGVRP